MKTTVCLFALLASAAACLPAQAQDRYATRPPVVLSPDLSAPWVMQLHSAGPVHTNRGLFQRRRLPDTAAVQVPRERSEPRRMRAQPQVQQPVMQVASVGLVDGPPGPQAAGDGQGRVGDGQAQRPPLGPGTRRRRRSQKSSRSQASVVQTAT